jgi:hypothetical protein
VRFADSGFAAAKHYVLARPPRWGVRELPWLGGAVAIFIAQRIGVSLLDQGGWQADLRRAIFFSTTFLLIALALHFRYYLGAWFIAAGIAMNFIPMASHGGLMPVSYELIAESGEFPQITEADIGQQVENSKDIVLLREDINFEPLSDRYVLTLPLYRTNIYSLGDFVAFAGMGRAALQIVIQVFYGGRDERGQRDTGTEGTDSVAAVTVDSPRR